jgi:hypothetical protein
VVFLHNEDLLSLDAMHWYDNFGHPDQIMADHPGKLLNPGETLHHQGKVSTNLQETQILWGSERKSCGDPLLPGNPGLFLSFPTSFSPFTV